MARADKSIFEVIDENSAPKAETAASEIATTVLQQQMMEQAGELQAVSYIGPNGKYIPGHYSPVERAFLPKFQVTE